MEVRYTRTASAHLAEHVASLRAANRRLAIKRLAKELARALRRIAAFPHSGSRVPEVPGAPIRQFFIGEYRFFYYVDDAKQTVFIVALWHGAQIPNYPQLPAP